MDSAGSRYDAVAGCLEDGNESLSSVNVSEG